MEKIAQLLDEVRALLTAIRDLLDPNVNAVNVYRSLDVQATPAQIAPQACQVDGYYILNVAASTRYVKFYDVAQPIAAGTGIPKITLGIPAGAAANLSLPLKSALEFKTGLAIAATTGIADNSTAAPTANDVVANIFYR